MQSKFAYFDLTISQNKRTYMFHRIFYYHREKHANARSPQS